MRISYIDADACALAFNSSGSLSDLPLDSPCVSWARHDQYAESGSQVAWVLELTDHHINVDQPDVLYVSSRPVPEKYRDGITRIWASRRHRRDTDNAPVVNPQAEGRGNRFGDAIVPSVLSLMSAELELLDCELFVYDEQSDELLYDQIQDVRGMGKPDRGLIGLGVRSGEVVHDYGPLSGFHEPSLDGDSRGACTIFVPVIDEHGIPFAICRARRLTSFNDDDQSALLQALSFSRKSIKKHVLSVIERYRKDEPAILLGGAMASLMRTPSVNSRQFQGDGFAPVFRFFRPAPTWAIISLIGSLILMFAILGGGRISDTARGIGMIVAQGEELVASPYSGRVVEWLAEPGEHVKAGQPVVRLSSDDIQDRYTATIQALSDRQLRLLLYPGEPSLEAAIEELKFQKKQLEARMERELVTANREGIVANLHRRPGEYVETGGDLFNLRDIQGERLLRLAVPADYVSRIEKGALVTFRLFEYPEEVHHLTVESVWTDPMMPDELSRFLPGLESNFSRRIIIVESRFEGTEPGRDLFVGLQGEAQVRTGSRPVLSFLMPSLIGG
jgi:hypothetical protein